jgi:hypothetical protein
MIKKLFLKLIIFLYFINIISYSQQKGWILIDSCKEYLYDFPHKSGCDFEVIKCFNEYNCIAVGNMNRMFPWNRVTRNGGGTWETTLRDTFRVNPPLLPKPPKVIDVSYPDSNLCIILCDSGYYWRSIDYCKTWEKKRINDINYHLMTAKIQMYDNLFGVLITSNKVFITFDGGIEFNKVELNLPDFIQTITLEDIFILKNTIYILACTKELLEFIIKSNDRGNSWTVLNSFHTNYYRVSNIYFLDELCGYASASVQYNPPEALYRNIILYTSNGGLTWDTQLDTLINPQSRLSYRLFFIDKNNGIALGAGWKLMRTSNGGKNWYRDTLCNYPYLIDTPLDIALITKTDMIAIMVNESNIYKYSEEETSVSDAPQSTNNGFLAIYPNPISSPNAFTVKLKLRKSANIKLKIYNTIGNLLEERSSESPSDEFEWLVATDSYPTGAYCVRVESDAGENASKVFVVLR